MRKRKEIDKTISAIVLIAFAVIWLINFIMAQTNGVSDSMMRGITIARDIMQILTFIVLLYNAWGWSGNMIYRIIIIAIAVWLIFCVIAQYIPNLNLNPVYFIK